MIGLRPVLLGLLSVGDVEILRASDKSLLHYNTILAYFPGVEPLLNPPPDCAGCGDMSGYLQDYHLRDNEPLQVPLSVPHSMHIFDHGPDEATLYLSTWRVVAPGGHDRKVMPPPLPCLIGCNTSMEVSAGVRVHPLPVDLLE